MRITFDAGKDAANLQKHGVSLAHAAALNWNEAIIAKDMRRDYGEERLIGLVPHANRLYCVIFVDRADGRRIISLRKANSREVHAYVQTIQADHPDA